MTAPTAPLAGFFYHTNLAATHNGHPCDLADVSLVGSLEPGCTVLIYPTRNCPTCGLPISTLQLDEVEYTEEELEEIDHE